MNKSKKSSFGPTVKAAAQNWLLPPGISRLIVQLRKSYLPEAQVKADEHNPFEQYVGEEWSLLCEALDSANAYLEFGCGLSTEFVSQNYKCRIRSVETSPEWVNHVRKQVSTEIEVIHVDLGPPLDIRLS